MSAPLYVRTKAQPATYNKICDNLRYWKEALRSSEHSNVRMRLYYDQSIDTNQELRGILDSLKHEPSFQLVKFKCSSSYLESGRKTHKGCIGDIINFHALMDDEHRGKPSCVCLLDLATVRTHDWWKLTERTDQSVTAIVDVFDLPAFGFQDVGCDEPIREIIRPHHAIFFEALPNVLWSKLPELITTCELREHEARRSMLVGPQAFGEDLYEDFHEDFPAILLTKIVRTMVERKKKLGVKFVMGDVERLRERIYSQIRWNGDRSAGVRELCTFAKKQNCKDLLKMIERRKGATTDVKHIVQTVYDWIPYLKKMSFDAKVVRAIEICRRDSLPNIDRYVRVVDKQRAQFKPSSIPSSVSSSKSLPRKKRFIDANLSTHSKHYRTGPTIQGTSSLSDAKSVSFSRISPSSRIDKKAVASGSISSSKSTHPTHDANLRRFPDKKAVAFRSISSSKEINDANLQRVLNVLRKPGKASVMGEFAGTSRKQFSSNRDMNNGDSFVRKSLSMPSHARVGHRRTYDPKQRLSVFSAHSMSPSIKTFPHKDSLQLSRYNDLKKTNDGGTSNRLDSAWTK